MFVVSMAEQPGKDDCEAAKAASRATDDWLTDDDD
jgi:hypothetical protein